MGEQIRFANGPNPKIDLKLNHARKNSKVKLGLKNLAILPSYFDYIFVHLKQKARLRPELSPKFLSTLGPNPARLITRKQTKGFQNFLGDMLFVFVKNLFATAAIAWKQKFFKA